MTMNGWEAGLGYILSPRLVLSLKLNPQPFEGGSIYPVSIRPLFFWRSCAASLHGMVFLRRESGSFVNGLEGV